MPVWGSQLMSRRLRGATQRGSVRRLATACASIVLAIGLSGCIAMDGGLRTQRVASGEVPTPLGPMVRDNRSPMEAALACFGDHVRVGTENKPRVIAVGDVKDYTGKYSINEGNAITQGGALMVYSALGKIGSPIVIAERFDPTVAERELAYTDRRQLGDGESHEVNGNRVPWLPYFGGTITKSDYYIIGGITELNYDIRSGGVEAQINNIGPKARVYTQSVAVDLRIVDSKSLVVLKTVSLTKQFSGYEVGAGIFRFFGTDLFDINIGAKGQEPLQLGIRTALEEATMRLVGAVTHIDPAPCLTQRLATIPKQSADELRGRAMSKTGVEAKKGSDNEQATAELETPSGTSLNKPNGRVSLNATGGSSTGEMVQVGFEFGDASLTGAAQAVLDKIAQRARAGAVDVMIVARDTENWDPAKRDSLIDQRLAAIAAALANRGIASAAIGLTWRPDRADTSIHRDGPGLQEIARLRIGG